MEISTRCEKKKKKTQQKNKNTPSLSLCQLWIADRPSFFPPWIFTAVRLQFFSLIRQSYASPLMINNNPATRVATARQVWTNPYLGISNVVYSPVVAFLAKLFLEVTQGEAVSLHHAAIRNFLAAEKVGDHQLLRPENTTWVSQTF